MIISRTPFRVSFFGGGTDYPAWYRDNGGAVLSTTIDKYCYITIRYLPPFFPHKHRVVYSLIENARSVDEIRHPVVRALLKAHALKKGVEIHHDGDLPARTGLGSSSSFTVGMINSLRALEGRIVSKEYLAREAIHIERDVLKETVGSQDQVAVAYGGFNKIVFHGDHKFGVEPVTIRKERLETLQSSLMLVYTGLPRFASKIALAQVRSMDRKSREMTAMRQMVDHAANILYSNADICEFGKLLHDSWSLKKTLSHKITNPDIDTLYDAALRSGAIGGKLLGAGGGGFMLLFVPHSKRKKVKDSIKKPLEVKFAFEREGSRIIYYDPRPA